MSDTKEQPVDATSLTPDEQKQKKRRNQAIALALSVFIALVFLVTLLRLGGSVAERPF
ncbi:MAG: hypothetical protein AAFW68_07565 [Pseudomonadota bacterium]